jgi:hypothetical protein
MMIPMQMQSRDPDGVLVATFRNMVIPNAGKSAAEGRPIFDDVEVCEVRVPGSRNWTPYPAHAHSHWRVDPFTGEQTSITYAQRFEHQYRQFTAQQQQTKSGTPLDFATFLTEGQRAGLQAQNVYTVEQLSTIDGQELKNLGPSGRDWKNRADEYLAAAKANAPATQLMAELEAMRARNMALEEDNEALKKTGGEGQFKDMDLEQIREYITAHTGQAPVGSLNRKALVRMALDARPDKAA